MGWRIAHREKGDKYRLWSTVSDRWLTDWSTKRDIQRYITEDYLWEYKKKVIEVYLKFPHHWPSKERMAYILDEAGKEAYSAWLKTLIDAGDTYYELVENKYNEVVKALAD